MNAKRHAKNLLIVTKPGAMCLSRWLKSVEVVGWWALGIKVHGLFVRAWVQVAGGKLSAGARRAAAAALARPAAGPAAGPAAADADPGDDPNVDQHKAKAKSRFRKGLHFMQDALALTVVKANHYFVTYYQIMVSVPYFAVVTPP